jgi:hypothetical protein
MIILFGSAVSVHKYRNPSANKQYYKPPNRSYNWDDRLRTTQPPPGMPNFIEIRKYEMERSSVAYALDNFPQPAED